MLTGHVVDAADFLPPSAEQRITERLTALEEATTDEVVVVTIESLHGASIEEVAHDLGNRWGLGRSDVDNGVLLIVASEEGKVRIAVGAGLEGLLTDQRTQAIVDRMGPKFDQGLPVDAIESAVAQIDSLLRSDPRRPQYATGKKAA